MFKGFEDYLQTVHAEQYVGTDDNSVDDYDDWLCDLGVDDYIRYANIYARINSQEAVSNYQESQIKHQPIKTNIPGVGECFYSGD